jgi:hypothetical protein
MTPTCGRYTSLYLSNVTMRTDCCRCAKRNKPEQCVYHPAPLTKAPIHQDTSSDKSSPRVNSFSTAYLSPSYRELSGDSSYPEPKRVKRTETVQYALSLDGLPEKHEPQTKRAFEELGRPLSDSTLQADALGFDNGAGFIHQSAILAENELSIGIQPPNMDTTMMSKVSQLHIDRGAAVLTLLKDIQSIKKYIDKYVGLRT